MIKHSNRFWISVLLLGWAFDFLFWGHTPGVNFAIFVLAVLTAGIVLLSSEGLRPKAWTLALLAPVLFFATMFFCRGRTFQRLSQRRPDPPADWRFSPSPTWAGDGYFIPWLITSCVLSS